MGATCQQCGLDLVDFGEPDADGWIVMICPGPNPSCPTNTRRQLSPRECKARQAAQGAIPHLARG